MPRVLVIDDDGNNLGVMDTSAALRLAHEHELDLIEVSPLANPPVCRIMNLGKWQYQQSQKTKKQKNLDTKVVRLTFKIGAHDRDVRVAQTTKFLTKGHRVKIEMRLRGREKEYPDLAKDMFEKFITELTVPVVREQDISKLGFTITALLAKKG